MKKVKLYFDEQNMKFMVDDVELKILLEERFCEEVEVMFEDNLVEKRTNLTRGEILRGIELGHFKQGDQFIRRHDGMIITVKQDLASQYFGGNFVILKAFPEEIWDIHLSIKIGDWVARNIGEKTVSVCKVQDVFVAEGVRQLTVKYGGATATWLSENVRKATKDEIEYAKRSEAFESKGRLVNEYKVGDVLPREADDENYLKVLGVDNHGVLLSGGSFRGWVEKESASVPVFFVEDMVREDDGE